MKKILLSLITAAVLLSCQSSRDIHYQFVILFLLYRFRLYII